MATAASTLVRNAVKAIANADATLRTLCGRTTNIMVSWKTALAAATPVMGIMITPNVRIGGLGDRRRVSVLTAGFAEGDGALAKAEQLTQRLREILTPAAFQAQGLDAWVAWFDAADREEDPDTNDGPTRVAQSQLDFPVILSAPQ